MQSLLLVSPEVGGGGGENLREIHFSGSISFGLYSVLCQGWAHLEGDP